LLPQFVGTSCSENRRLCPTWINEDWVWDASAVNLSPSGKLRDRCPASLISALTVGQQILIPSASRFRRGQPSADRDGHALRIGDHPLERFK